MKRIVLVTVGVILLSIGAVDWAVGALVPHSRVILVIGAIAVAAAGFMHQWQKMQKPQWPLLMALVIAIFGASSDAYAETIHAKVLTPPDITPMVHWNPSAATGMDAWAIVFIGIALGLVYWFVIKSMGRCPCQPWKRL